MQEKIRAKMEKHVESILEKPEITAEEYMLISAYLAKLEMEEERAKIAKSSEKNRTAVSSDDRRYMGRC